MGLFGSQFMASTADLTRFSAVFNIDMIGLPYSKKRPCGIISRVSYSRIFNEIVGEKFFTDQPDSFYPRSDHYSFSQVPIHLTFCTGSDKTPNYHDLGYEASTLDYDFMEKTVNQILKVIERYDLAP